MCSIASWPFGTTFHVTGTAPTHTSTRGLEGARGSSARATTACVATTPAARASVERARVRSASTPDPLRSNLLNAPPSRRDDHRSGHVAAVQEADVLVGARLCEGHLGRLRQRHL